MTRNNSTKSIAILSILILLAVFWATFARAHCDTMNGPVVTAARKALESGNVNLVLMWVRKDDEATIKEAFSKTLAVRKLSPDAKRLADMYFFETLVRVHRAGEGVPYTGLKDAETSVEPGIAMADHAIEAGSVNELVTHMTGNMETELRERFTRLVDLKRFKQDDVVAGRKYVEAYVSFIHYVERLHQALGQSASGHYEEPAHTSTHEGLH